MTCTAVSVALAVAHWWLWPQAVAYVVAESPAIVRTLKTHEFSPECDRRYWLQVKLGDHEPGLRAESPEQEERRLFSRDLAQYIRAVEAANLRKCVALGWPVEACGP